MFRHNNEPVTIENSSLQLPLHDTRSEHISTKVVTLDICLILTDKTEELKMTEE